MTKPLFPLFSLAVALFATASACRSQPAASASDAKSIVDRARGVYVAIGPKGDGDRGDYTDEAIASTASGLYVRTYWSTISPSPDRYDWSQLDYDISRAKRQGKRVSIGIRAGAGTPPWLLDRIPTLTFVTGGRRGQMGRCQTIRYPVFWNKAYADAYGRMMAAMAGHLRANGTYGDVTIVKITGLNAQTEELHIPSEKPAWNKIREGTACQISDAVPIWQKAGYRPAFAIETWKSLAGSVATAFPDKLLAMPILNNGGFPMVDADGNDVGRRSPRRVDVLQQIIKTGVQRYPGRFAVQWTALNDKTFSPTIAEAMREGALFGAQSNFRGGPGRGAGCQLTRGTRGQPCTPAEYRSMLRYGEQHQAVYLEVFPVDAARFGPAIAESVKALR